MSARTAPITIKPIIHFLYIHTYYPEIHVEKVKSKIRWTCMKSSKRQQFDCHFPRHTYQANKPMRAINCTTKVQKSKSTKASANHEHNKMKNKIIKKLEKCMFPFTCVRLEVFFFLLYRLVNCVFDVAKQKQIPSFHQKIYSFDFFGCKQCNLLLHITSADPNRYNTHTCTN